MQYLIEIENENESKVVRLLKNGSPEALAIVGDGLAALRSAEDMIRKALNREIINELETLLGRG